MQKEDIWETMRKKNLMDLGNKALHATFLHKNRISCPEEFIYLYFFF